MLPDTPGNEMFVYSGWCCGTLLCSFLLYSALALPVAQSASLLFKTLLQYSLRCNILCRHRHCTYSHDFKILYSTFMVPLGVYAS